VISVQEQDPELVARIDAALAEFERPEYRLRDYMFDAEYLSHRLGQSGLIGERDLREISGHLDQVIMRLGELAYHAALRSETQQ